MARKPLLSIEALVELGSEKLAQLVPDEAGRSPSFRRLANAALAGAKGPDAVAKLIDRRLAALEKARGFIEWDKARAFRDDLHATIAAIIGELAQGSVATAFEQTLSPEILREYLAVLPDFGEFDALDRAFTHASVSSKRYYALSLFMEWPRLDLAADFIVRNQDQWDGRQYYFLPPIAQTLEHRYPLAATVIYRALIDHILSRARSKAYGHAARYLAKLSVLAQDMDVAQSNSINIAAHPAYVQTLRERHGRKMGFWSLVKAQ